jgi:hypothetical protein
MRILVSLLLAFMLSACSLSVNSSEELPLTLIKQVDQLQAHAMSAVQFGALQHPGQDFIDKVSAYYTAMNVAWAWRDKEDHEYYASLLLIMFKDLLAEAEQPAEPEAPKQDL